MKNITLSGIEAMDKLARVQFANSLPGPKPVALVGSIAADGQTNLAPFSTVTHLGSSPALIGLVSRPDLVDRHTLSNILSTRSYTINHIHPGILPVCIVQHVAPAEVFGQTAPACASSARWLLLLKSRLQPYKVPLRRIKQ